VTFLVDESRAPSASAAPIRVLIAEDSPTARALLVELFSTSPDFQVAAAVANGADAIERAVELAPDLVVMDVYMPITDGLAATKAIMREAPTPIMMVSGSASVSDVALGLSATQAGALILVEKPAGPGSPTFDEDCRQLLSMAKAMAGVKVVRRWTATDGGSRRRGKANAARSAAAQPVRMIAIGTSTGGPAALHRTLIDLPSSFPVPIVVVQHMARGFIDGLAKWLGANVALRVIVASASEVLVPGTVYIAPDNAHFGADADGQVALSSTSPIGGFRPSVDFLFDSFARAYGSGLVAVILTGMGQDGLEGLRTVKARNGHVIAQDEASSIVFGMNGKAVEAGLADEILPLDAMGHRLNELAQAAKV
jgi:two-component system chemotaxis response regulator CheB